ncbi:hypothetical protein QBC40DRAFT_347389 [Triangularia verruculosa]|uniref:Uncharacterized protein n=1 Tax=Triangularia verruculosa TaxID=2587418 RepID=A0AAN6XKJ3_9PEZI|nr:hypothetical protein QBC40DRAFT_347389 [Triangularia verruculosa]
MGEIPQALPSPWPDLDALLTPSLFTLITSSRFPYSKKVPINFSHFGRDIFLADPFSPLVRDAVWPALLALSKYTLDQLPDLHDRYLPHPTDHSYPEQCLGLLLLLDNLPRLLFKGIDARWTFDFFDRLAQRVVHSWIGLPKQLRPDSRERWGDTVRAGMDFWVAVRFWFGVVLAHSERQRDQQLGLGYTEETRLVVEEASGLLDPWRGKRGVVLGDDTMFPREYKLGPPQGEGVTMEQWVFWAGMLMDCHKPIVDRFGRYPWLNAITGRISTEEEEEYVKRIGSFAEVEEAVKRRVRRDVDAGRWTPLGTDSL